MMRIKFLFLVFVCFLSGCFDGLKPVGIVKHPDSPMLIQEIKGNEIRVAIYSKFENKLIDYGWIELEKSLVGWTLSKYDWESFLENRNKK